MSTSGLVLKNNRERKKKEKKNKKGEGKQRR